MQSVSVESGKAEVYLVTVIVPLAGGRVHFPINGTTQKPPCLLYTTRLALYSPKLWGENLREIVNG